MRDWFSRTSNRPSLLAEAIYHRFLDRLALYAGEKIDEDTLRAHALRYLVPEFYLLRSPFALPDMAEAVKLLRAFAEGPKLRKLVLYGDRDADGITSTAMLWLFCRHKLGIPGEKITALLPREQDKYGITDEVAARIAAENPELLITLDCGSSNKQELSRLKAETGTKIIIIDHHFIPEQSTDFPEVEAFVNPKRLAEPDFVRDYATAAVVLRFIQAVLFSYSKEYGEPIGIKTPDEQCVLTNGVRDEQSDFASCQRKYFIGPNPPEGCHDLLAIFAHMARQDHAVFRLWEFYRALPEAFSAVEIFNLVQSASFRKSRKVLEPYLPLAAIGLVADLMPVYADNRILIRAGLAVMNHEQAKLPTGLDALLKRLNLQNAISEQDLAFRVAPAINAAGRMGNAMLALELLTAEDPLAATKAAHFLYETNSSRKAVSEQSIALLEEALDPRSHDFPVALALHDQFHRGVSGLIAARLAEKMAKPAVVLVPDGDCYRGSVRASRNENVYALVESLQDLLLQYGGHRQAAGFSLACDKVQEFADALFAKAKELFLENSTSSVDPFRNFYPPLEIDGQMLLPTLWDELLSHAPYGVMNPHPVLSIRQSGRISVSGLGKDGTHAVLRFAASASEAIEAVWFFHNGRAEEIAGREDLTISAEPHTTRFMGKTQYRLRILQISGE